MDLLSDSRTPDTAVFIEITSQGMRGHFSGMTIVDAAAEITQRLRAGDPTVLAKLIRKAMASDSLYRLEISIHPTLPGKVQFVARNRRQEYRS